MVGTEGCFSDLQGLLEEGLCSTILAFQEVNSRQVVQACSQVGVFLAQGFFEDGVGLPQKGSGLVILALGPVQTR